MFVIALLSCSKEPPQALYDRAHALFLQGDLVRAAETANVALKQIGSADPEWSGKFQLLLADVAVWRGRSEDALALSSATPLSTVSAGDLFVRREVISSVACARMHRFEDAARHLDSASAACSKGCAAAGELFRARGVLALERQQLVPARDFFLQSRSFAQQTSDSFLESTSLLNLSAVALRQEHYDEAIDWAQDADRLARKLHANQLLEKTSGNLGWAYYKMGDFDRAEELYSEAESAANRLGLTYDRAKWLTAMGDLKYDREQFAAAEACYRQALGISRTLASKSEIIDAVSALAFVSLKQEKSAEAAQYATEAIDLTRQENDRAGELYPLLVRAQLAVKSGDLLHAEEMMQTIAQESTSDDSLRWEAHNLLANLSAERGDRAAANVHYLAALAVFERARERLTREDSRLPFFTNGSHLYNDYIHFLAEQGEVAAALDIADTFRARTLAEGLHVLLKKQQASPLHPRELARRLDSTILFYWLAADRSYLWAVTPNSLRMYTLPPEATIAARVRAYRTAVTGPRDPSAYLNSDGTALFETLIGPAQSVLPKDARVLVIADGVLNTLNFETLLARSPVPHYWIEDVTVVNAASLAVLARGKGWPATKHKLLLIGDPIAPNSEYINLPASAKEASQIERHFDPAEKLVRLRENATPRAYFESQPENFSYIHFATHGTASRVNPLESAIVLSRAGPEDEAFKLYARDIVRHPIRANLVTIATCYGAGTRTYAGEGLVGLSWAFMRAGANHVVAALWEVNDNSTAELMSNFYAELQRGQPPDQALRIAKLSLLHSGSVYRKPFYWAPFQFYTGI